MEKYKIKLKPSAVKEIENISFKKDRQRIIQRIGELASNPRPTASKKLSGYDKYRLRQGRFRIIYGIKDELLTVYIVKVGQRKDIYRNLM